MSARRSAVAVVFALAAGCVLVRNVRDDVSVDRPPAQHAVEAAQLRELMAELDDLTGSRLPATLSASRDLDAIYADISYVASALAGTAADIPELLPELGLSRADEKRFRELAAYLRAHAVGLEDSARRRDRFRLDGAVSRIDGTCEACHREFRSVAPDLHGPEP